MSLAVSYRPKPSSEHCIYLLKNLNGLDKADISTTQKTWFRKRFDGDEPSVSNNAGTMTVVCRVPNVISGIENEKVRVTASTVYDQIYRLVSEISIVCDDAAVVELFLEGLILSAYRFDKYLSRKPDGLLNVVHISNSKVNLPRIIIISDAVNWARDMVNEPVSSLNAVQMSAEIKSVCSKVGIRVEIFGKQKIQSLKMGGLLAVNKGSVDPPTFTILEWKPKGAINKKPIVLIGKGIVFDTGGLSLKPTKDSMDLMKCDMAGAAAVAAVTLAVAKLKLPLHIVTLIPATDNRPGGNAYAPGDIIKMFDGTTVEVMNTDAEGRMALADALAYSNKYKPELVIDAATLTGAAARAVGIWASCVMGTAPQTEFNKLIAAGDKTADRVVQFPFWDEYEADIKSPIADLKNTGGPEAGMITAGKFLAHFTNHPYIHIDIAGPAFLTRRKNYRGLGASGAGVRLLVEFLMTRARK